MPEINLEMTLETRRRTEVIAEPGGVGDQTQVVEGAVELLLENPGATVQWPLMAAVPEIKASNRPSKVVTVAREKLGAWGPCSLGYSYAGICSGFFEKFAARRDRRQNHADGLAPASHRRARRQRLLVASAKNLLEPRARPMLKAR